MSKELIKCNVTVGRFQPFTEGHMKMVEAGFKENGLGCVILQIPNTKNPKSENCPQKSKKNDSKPVVATNTTIDDIIIT